YWIMARPDKTLAAAPGRTRGSTLVTPAAQETPDRPPYQANAPEVSTRRPLRHEHLLPLPVRRSRAGRLLPRRTERAARDHRGPLHRARSRARRHPLLPLRLRGG